MIGKINEKKKVQKEQQLDGHCSNHRSYWAKYDGLWYMSRFVYGQGKSFSFSFSFVSSTLQS